jgi:AraC-like DNA-binding protein
LRFGSLIVISVDNDVKRRLNLANRWDMRHIRSMDHLESGLSPGESDSVTGAAVSLSARARVIISRCLADGICTHEYVASGVGLHPRTLQRRLREEGTTFEEIKDGVRRDVALRCLKQRHIPLVRVAEILGYSETSVLSRSCYRWFARSPRQLRSQLETSSSESEALAS